MTANTLKPSLNGGSLPVYHPSTHSMIGCRSSTSLNDIDIVSPHPIWRGVTVPAASGDRMGSLTDGCGGPGFVGRGQEMSDKVKAAIGCERAKGYGSRKIAGLDGCGVGTVQKIITAA